MSRPRCTGNVRERDWVRFMHGGELVISQVEYVFRDSIHGDQVVTTAAQISMHSILEVRRQAEWEVGVKHIHLRVDVASLEATNKK